ncbi:hypothetical protein FQZ97_938940 [compost metagenome]
MPPTPATSAWRTSGRSNTSGTSATCSGMEARNSGGRYSGGTGTMALICFAIRGTTASGIPIHRSLIPSGSAISSRTKRPRERRLGSVRRTSSPTIQPKVMDR